MAGDDLPKSVTKCAFGAILTAAIIGYTVEFSIYQDTHHKSFWIQGHAGFIFLWIFMVVFFAVGIVAAVMDNWMVAVAFVVLWTTTVLVARAYMYGDNGWGGYDRYHFIMGSLSACLGVAFAILTQAGGGGK